MPKLAPVACNRPGCSGCRVDGECTKCGAGRHKWLSRPDDRASSSSRGYGYRWRKIRMAFLRSHPLCEVCKAASRVSEATEVHHKVAKRNGGSDSFDNLQALCKPCHSGITARGG
jgi:5-methylcytosine-specific restriction protein A